MFREIILSFGLFVCATAFPSGAPADACAKSRTNSPNHGSSKAQTLNSFPYEIIASSDQYNPGVQILGILQGL